jgi:recombination protein RecA
VEKGIIEKSGAWYSYAGNRIGQGREHAKDFIRNNATVAKEVEEKIVESHNLKK